MSTYGNNYPSHGDSYISNAQANPYYTKKRPYGQQYAGSSYSYNSRSQDLDLVDSAANHPADTQDLDDYFPTRRIASHQGRTTFAMLILGLILIIISVFTPGWAWTKETGTTIWEGDLYNNLGLFYYCSTAYSEERPMRCILVSDLHNIPVWWYICQALGILALILGVVVTVFAGSYICYLKYNRKPKIVGILSMLILLLVFIQIAGFVLFCVKYLEDAMNCCSGEGYNLLEYHLNYGFILACFATAFNIVAFIASVYEWYSLRQ